MARIYNQACPLAGSLDILGERWTLLLCRELMLGPQRFGDLQTGLPGIGANLLTKRLRELEEGGIIEGPDGERGSSYRLTRTGEAIRPVVRDIMRWGIRYFYRDEAPAHMKACIKTNNLAPDSTALLIEIYANLNPSKPSNYTARLEIEGNLYTVYHMNCETIIKRNTDAPTIASVSINVASLLMAMRHEIDRSEAENRAKFSGDKEALDHLFAAICREWDPMDNSKDTKTAPSTSAA